MPLSENPTRESPPETHTPAAERQVPETSPRRVTSQNPERVEAEQQDRKQEEPMLQEFEQEFDREDALSTESPAIDEEMAEAIANIDGEQVLDEAINALPERYKTVYQAGIAGPPPINKKELGMLVAKTTVVMQGIPAMGERKFLNMGFPPGLVTRIIEEATRDLFTHTFTLKAIVEGQIYACEGIPFAQMAPETDPEVREMERKMEDRIKTSMSSEEKNSKTLFAENIKRFLDAQKAEGKSFLSEREQKAVKDGRVHPREWNEANILVELGRLLEIGTLCESDAIPLKLSLKKAEISFAYRQTIVFRKKDGKNPDAFVKALRAEIGKDRLETAGNTWEIHDIADDEMEKLEAILKKTIKTEKGGE